MTFHFRGACFLLAVVSILNSCNKESIAPGGKPPAVFDTSESAKAVTVTEKEHRIFFRPKAGEMFRYRIVQRSNSSASASGPMTKSEAAISEDSYYIKETIRSIRQDSSVDLTFRFDSISIKLKKDTLDITLSSSKPADRSDPRFSSYAALLGEDIGVIITPFGS